MVANLSATISMIHALAKAPTLLEGELPELPDTVPAGARDELRSIIFSKASEEDLKQVSAETPKEPPQEPDVKVVEQPVVGCGLLPRLHVRQHRRHQLQRLCDPLRRTNPRQQQRDLQRRLTRKELLLLMPSQRRSRSRSIILVGSRADRRDFISFFLGSDVAQYNLRRAAKARIDRMVKPHPTKKHLDVPEWLKSEWKSGDKNSISDLLRNLNFDKALYLSSFV